MSLINQVLRELDGRTAAVAAAWPATVRATPVAALPPPSRRIAVASLGGLCIVAAAWLVAMPPERQSSAGNGMGEPVAAAPQAMAAAPVPSPATATPAGGDAVAAESVVLAADIAPPAEASPWPAFPVPARPSATRTNHAATLVESTSPSRPRAPKLAMAAVHPSPPLPEPTPDALPQEPAGAVRIEKRMPPAKPHERADAAYRQGLAAQERGDPAEAARAYAAALHEEAGLVAARVGLVSVLMAQGRSAEAEGLLQAGLAIDPLQPLLAQPMARLLVDRGDLTAAIGLMQTALPAGAGSADYQACLAALLQRAGREREAAAHFDAALRLQPDNGVWWMGLAMSLAAQGQGEVARTAFARARSSGKLSPELMHFVEMRMREPL